MEEEAMSDFVTVSCYMSDHEGFFGKIKNSARDFVVTEINILGQLVTEKNSFDDVSSHLPDDTGPKCHGGDESSIEPFMAEQVKERRESAAEELDSTVVDCRSADGVAEFEDALDLEAILSQTANDALEKFAASVPDASRQDSTELSLGSFPEKHHRALVHRAVRCSFPFLKTVTNKTEVLVKRDPDYEELARLVSEQEAGDFLRFIDAKVPNTSFTFARDDSKEHRKAVHHFLSKRFGKLVETKSFTDGPSPGEGKTAITARFRARSKPAKKRTAADCQEDCAVYTGFVLQKENLETLEAISYMASQLGVLPSDFTYAGIKDKRALTHQSMVVKKVSPQRLMQKNTEFQKKGLQLSQVQPVSEPLHLGRLQGNRFQLVVRDLRAHRPESSASLPSLVRKALDNVKAKGFVNFYGPQRFGAGQSVTADRIGAALLKGDMEKAVQLFFTPDEGDSPQNRAKSHFLQTGNAKESLAMMPQQRARERLMLRALHRYGTGEDRGAAGRTCCVQAWLSLPHSMRLFYIHAYCSRVWNQAAAFRLRRLGCGASAVRGDLVWSGESRAEGREQVHVVTAAEEADAVFSLRQVVLPMPGNSVQYPENALGPWYTDRLKQDGLQNCTFRITCLKMNVPGCYRPLLAYPQNLTHSWLEVSDGSSAESDVSSTPHPGPSLTLTFDLDASCYATVCLREIMKCDP
ncbi:hypothetical protein GJAV_G00273440 [Gymnothorax javanicus]|nr:hypothetical protein GJAV_G00273440 [Gymnothorax javanicus]